MTYEEIIAKLKERKKITEEGNIAEFWDNDIDSEEDEAWADAIWEEIKKKYQP